MAKRFTTERRRKVMLSEKTRTAMGTLLMAGFVGVMAPASAVAAPASIASANGVRSAEVSVIGQQFPTTIRCNIPRLRYGSCSSDNVAIRPSRKVCIALISSGGKQVKFQVRNQRGGHRLSTGPWQAPNHKYYFQWTNNT